MVISGGYGAYLEFSKCLDGLGAKRYGPMEFIGV
jgi:hypothetical protein